MDKILFKDIDLSPEMLRAVEDMHYTEATGIQAGAIPLLLQGHDLIGRSSTGTGKTAAFGIPAVEMMDQRLKAPQVLILSPTRELAMQITDEMRKYAKYKHGISIACVYGGASMELQIRQLRSANIVIGTPGRIMDHMNRRTLKLDQLKMVILDEADEMLNMGFYEDIQTILLKTPEDRQTVLFSATMPPAILKITDEFLTDPQTVEIKSKERTIAAIDQYYYQVPQARKMDAVNLLLHYYRGCCAVIFCNTKSMVDELTAYLNENAFKAAGLHGDMKQSARTQVMNQFRTGSIQVLVATDVAARGIDVENVQAVINFDIPQMFEYYIHRIGRTGRAGKSGSSHTLVCNHKQLSTIKELERYIRAKITEHPLPTRNDIIEKQQETFKEALYSVITSGNFQARKDFVASVCTEYGCDVTEIACVFADMLLSEGERNIPVIRPVTISNNRNQGKRVLLSVSAGKNDRISPNNLVGAIVDATGLPSRAVGKISIDDETAMIEMSENDALTVLNCMPTTKIRGRKVSFTLSREKPARSNKAPVSGGRPSYDRSSRKNRSGAKFSKPHRRTHGRDHAE